MVGRQSRRSGSGQETLPEVRKWSGDPIGGSELVGRRSQRSGTGRKTLPEARKCSETLRRSGSGWETVSEVRKWSRVSPGGPELVRRPYRRSGSDLESLPEVQTR